MDGAAIVTVSAALLGGLGMLPGDTYACTWDGEAAVVMPNRRLVVYDEGRTFDMGIPEPKDVLIDLRQYGGAICRRLAAVYVQDEGEAAYWLAPSTHIPGTWCLMRSDGASRKLIERYYDVADGITDRAEALLAILHSLPDEVTS